jgi:hypothetical protein
MFVFHQVNNFQSTEKYYNSIITSMLRERRRFYVVRYKFYVEKTALGDVGFYFS